MIRSVQLNQKNQKFVSIVLRLFNGFHERILGWL